MLHIEIACTFSLSLIFYLFKQWNRKTEVINTFCETLNTSSHLTAMELPNVVLKIDTIVKNQQQS